MRFEFHVREHVLLFDLRRLSVVPKQNWERGM